MQIRIMNKSRLPWATFSNGLRGDSRETGEGVVALEALAEPNGTFFADAVHHKAAETRELRDITTESEITVYHPGRLFQMGFGRAHLSSVRVSFFSRALPMDLQPSGPI